MSLHKQTLIKPDGRELILYSRTAIADGLVAPSPEPKPLDRQGHLRWHPLREEWVSYALHRQHRTFLPPAEWDPLAPMRDPAVPTELPSGAYDVAVFENLFPAFGAAKDPPESIVPTSISHGRAEVVVFTPDASGSLGALPLGHIDLVFQAWADRYAELSRRGDIDYVFVFENRGPEVGATLQHPHGQIYGFPFIPPVPATELRAQKAYYEKHGRGLLADHIQAELQDGVRMLYEGPSAVAFMPAFARYAYEVWIAPRRTVPSMAALDSDERWDLALAMKTVLLKYDRLWNRPFPYILVWHQAPCDQASHPEAHLHAEIYPAYRMPDRLKYLAGSEVGAGAFTADTLPEERVRELQAIEVMLE